MWGIITSVFFGLYLIMIFYLGFRAWTYIGRYASGFWRMIFWISFSLVVLSFPLTEFAEDFLSEIGGFWFALWGWYSMLAVVYTVLLLLIIDTIRLLDKRFSFFPSKLRSHKRTPNVIYSFVLIIVATCLIYGNWNAQNPVVTNYEITLAKKAGDLKNLKIAMLADIHYGEIINGEYLDRMVEILHETEPDLLLLAGDIIEGNPDLKTAEEIIRAFGLINPKYGKYAVPGNHDRWLRSKEGMLGFREAGVHILRDEVIEIADSFYIVGRDDPGHGRGRDRRDLVDLIDGLETSLPIILLDHQPNDLQDAGRYVDIQLSGHTHMGQIFPASFITGIIYELDCGILTRDSYNLIVTSGYGTWGPPLRIGTRSEIVLVTLNFME